jgi:hypothetical protein
MLVVERLMVGGHIHMNVLTHMRVLSGKYPAILNNSRTSRVVLM